MFVTTLEVREGKSNLWTLISPLRWDDGTAQFTVPAGFNTDLASIPAPLRGLFNPNGKSRRAAVLHDYLYCSKHVTRAKADWLFLKALKTCDVNWFTRSMFYSAVRAFGGKSWQWRDCSAADKVK